MHSRKGRSTYALTIAYNKGGGGAIKKFIRINERIRVPRSGLSAPKEIS